MIKAHTASHTLSKLFRSAAETEIDECDVFIMSRRSGLSHRTTDEGAAAASCDNSICIGASANGIAENWKGFLSHSVLCDIYWLHHIAIIWVYSGLHRRLRLGRCQPNEKWNVRLIARRKMAERVRWVCVCCAGSIVRCHPVDCIDEIVVFRMNYIVV